MKSKKSASKLSRSWKAALIILSAVFLYCEITYLVTALFMSRRVFDKTAAEDLAGISNISYITIDGDNTLTGYLLDNPDSNELLIYFYGISDDAASSMLMFQQLAENGTAYSDVDIAVIDRPGSGQSSGFSSDASMRESALDTVNYFSDGGIYCTDNITIMGYSLGTGPAVYAASVCGCADLILLSPYYSAADLYNSVTPVFYGPMKQLLGFTMDSYKYASQVDISPLIIAGMEDSRVPISSSRQLAQCFPSGCSFETVDNINHGDIPSAPLVLEIITARLSQH